MELDVADVQPNWEADVVAHKQDVFVAIDVCGLIGCCREGELCVAGLKRHMVCKVSRRNRRNSTGVREDSPATK